MPNNVDTLVVGSELHMHGARMTNVHGQQASAIADAAAVSGSPDESEHNEIVAKMNAVLTALRGVGIIARS